MSGFHFFRQRECQSERVLLQWLSIFPGQTLILNLGREGWVVVAEDS